MSQETNENSPSKSREKFHWGTRHTFVLLSFCGYACRYAMRANLSVTIVAMVQNADNENDSNIGTECPALISTPEDQSPNNEGWKYNWDSKQQGLILGAFYFGSVATQIPGGILAEKYGGKWVFGIGTLSSAIMTLLAPLASKAGFGILMACRIFAGLGEGMTYPAMHSMMSKWVPLNERSKYVTLITIGTQFGTIISMALSGPMSAHIIWQSTFYLFGALSCAWFLFWYLLVSNTPQTHPRITRKELDYIVNNIIETKNDNLPFPPLR